MAPLDVYARVVEIPPNYVSIAGLKVHPSLVKVIQEKVCPDTGFSPAYFWSAVEQVIKELRPEVLRCMQRRDDLQAKIDTWYQEKKRAGQDLSQPHFRPECVKFLTEIGYLEPDRGPVMVTTQFVDPEICQIPAPQLVVPSDNARYVLNAVNARWCSLYDALYGFDVISVTAMQTPGMDTGSDQKASGYNPNRGEAVIEFANGLLDEIAPLTTGKWSQAVRLWPKYIGAVQHLEVLLEGGQSTSLRTPWLFVGSAGNLGPPDAETAARAKAYNINTPALPDKGRIFLQHNGLHFILEIDRDHPIGKLAKSGIKDITVESSLTAILDMEDSVAAVDAEDKCKVYCNIVGVFRGTLEAPFVKDGKALTRRMAADLWFRNATGNAQLLPGRAIALVRNVGHHMFTDMVLTEDGMMVPEGFIDCFVTCAAALQDLRGLGNFTNSRMGSVYIVKPKQHGSEEVQLTSRLFGRVEELFGLRRNTIKMGIMDEERRTSANLRECLRAAAERVFFINTGFLDRTGDEIHTCMAAGPVVRKGDMKREPWIKAYEDSNVDVGLFSGLPGKGQIGKGMWAKPDSMKAMLEAKLAEPMSGASTAWVPSPMAGALHSIHYHKVDVPARQMQLAMRQPTRRESILEPPLMKGLPLGKDVIEHEVKDNVQSILGYVVRWVDMGIGCSKVPDLSNVGLMEDRATLRISSQLLANWLEHGVVSEEELRAIFLEMAKVVDQQNIRDKKYTPMSNDPDNNIAFQAALKLVLDGKNAPNGYTEFTLHEARRKVKESSFRSRL